MFGSAGLKAHHNSFSLIQHYSQERCLLILYSRRQEGLIAQQAKLDVLSTTGDFCSFVFFSSVFLSKYFVSFERSRGWKQNINKKKDRGSNSLPIVSRQELQVGR